MNSPRKQPAVARLIRILQDTAGLSVAEIAACACVPEPTLSRWATDQESPDSQLQQNISELAEIVLRLSEYYTAEEIRAWLYARHPQLDGRRAIDSVLEGQSGDVVAVLDRLDAAAYI